MINSFIEVDYAIMYCFGVLYCHVLTALVCIVTPRVSDKWNFRSSRWAVGVQLAGYFPLV